MKKINWFNVVDYGVLPVLFTLSITNLFFRAWFKMPSSYWDCAPWVWVFLYWGIIKNQSRLIKNYSQMVDVLSIILDEIKLKVDGDKTKRGDNT